LLSGKGQVLDSNALDTVKTYTLQQALKQDPLRVYKLNLKKSKLSELPEEVYQFKNLNVLDISKNKFKEFPKKIGTFQFLQELYISGNKIEMVTKEIGILVNLKVFEANQNGLVSLPPEIKFLKKLEFMDLWGNDIGSLPHEISELSNSLKELDMRVILMSKAEHEKIKSLLPNTKIKFSKSCNCGF
jgi:Leucine-rich repeat (LRR) protein